MRGKRRYILLPIFSGGWDHEETIEFVKSFSPELVVLDTSTPSIYNDVEVAAKIKEALPGIHVNLVGNHPTRMTDETFGLSKAIVQSVNSLTQFLVMYTITDRVESTKLFKIGIFLSGVTFFTFTLASDFWEIIPTQVLLGTSWAFLYVGALRYVNDSNVEKATVSGMLDSVSSLSSIIGPFLAAVIVPFGDYRTIMYIASSLAFISFVVFYVLRHSEKIFKSRPLRL